MKLHEHLDEQTKARLGVASKGKGNVITKRRKRNKRKQERLSERDLAELMGTNRQTYRRVNGKIKRK